MIKLHEFRGMNKPKQGKYGVEIEVESSVSDFKYDYVVPPGWITTMDGSLRNNYNLEYVFTQPKTLNGTIKSLYALQDMFNAEGVINEPSIRTGVHVHLNATNYTAEQLTKVILVYLSMERVLTNYCGEDRVGNLFCLRACDCPSFVETVRTCMLTGYWHYSLPADLYKYSALNLSTLSKHGSLEFRALRTPKVLTDIIEWINMIEAIEVYALNLESVSSIPYDMSYYSPDVWVKNVLGEKLFEKVQYPNLEKDVKADMRNIQVLYHTNVKEFTNNELSW